MFQPLRVQRHADPVMPDDLDPDPPSAAKNVQIPGMGVTAERFLHLKRQSVHPLRMSVRPTANQTRTSHARYGDHRRSNTSSTRRSAAAFTALPIRTPITSGQLDLDYIVYRRRHRRTRLIGNAVTGSNLQGGRFCCFGSVAFAPAKT
jgi:hypothetical protein